MGAVKFLKRYFHMVLGYWNIVYNNIMKYLVFSTFQKLYIVLLKQNAHSYNYLGGEVKCGCSRELLLPRNCSCHNTTPLSRKII